MIVVVLERPREINLRAQVSDRSGAGESREINLRAQVSDRSGAGATTRDQPTSSGEWCWSGHVISGGI